MIQPPALASSAALPAPVTVDSGDRASALQGSPPDRSATIAASATPSTPAELEQLGEEIAELAAHLHAATYRLLVRLRDFDEREGWNVGFLGCAQWLSWRTGIAPGAAREKVRVARALADLTLLGRAMELGELSYSKIRALTRIATPDNEEELLELALHATAAQVETFVRAWRRVDRLEEGERERERHESRYLTLGTDDDGSYVVRGRLDPEVGALLERALDVAVKALYDEQAMRTRTNVAAAEQGLDLPTPAQRRADALGLVVELALVSEGLATAVEAAHRANSACEVETCGSELSMSERPHSESLTSESFTSESLMSESLTSEPLTSESLTSESLTWVSPASEPLASQSVATESLTSNSLVPNSAASNSVASGALASEFDSAELPEAVPFAPEPISRVRPGSKRANDSAGTPARASRGTAKPLDRAARVQVVVHVDAEALRADSESGQSVLAGGLRVPAETSRRLACDASCVVMIHDNEGRLLDAGRGTRTVPPSIRRALDHRDGGCSFPGCNNRFTDAHHEALGRWRGDAAGQSPPALPATPPGSARGRVPRHEGQIRFARVLSTRRSSTAYRTVVTSTAGADGDGRDGASWRRAGGRRRARGPQYRDGRTTLRIAGFRPAVRPRLGDQGAVQAVPMTRERHPADRSPE